MKKVLIIVTIVAVIASLFIGVKSNKDHEQFLKEMAAIDHENDSLQLVIKKDDSTILALNTLDGELMSKLEHQKAKVVVIHDKVFVEKARINTLADHEIVTYFNTRYSVDTITRLLPLAQPVLVAAAKDLAEFDGAKELITVKDSVIAIQESRISTKDTIISKYVNKEVNFKKIITNQDTQIQGWKGQYSKLEFENKKLKVQNKFTKVAAGVVVGGLVYMMITK
jgi:hypothetical protein